MAGVKGRSGKATTLEAKLAKAAGGAKGGGNRSRQPALPPSTATDLASDDPVKRLGKPLTWGDELKRQQVEGERIQNRRREVEVQRAKVELATATDKARESSGKLRTMEWIRERDEKWNRAVEDRLDLVERILDTIDGITPDQRKAYLTAARAWRLETKRILASVHA
jgi:hypothetical protein